MTAEQHDTIDFVALSADRRELMLVIVEEREWTDHGALLPDLQAKLNTYISYALDGALAADHPQHTALPVHIQLRATHEPTERELDFLRIVAAQVLTPEGIRLSWRVIGMDEDHPI